MAGIYGDGTNVLIALEALNQLFVEFAHVYVCKFTHTHSHTQRITKVGAAAEEVWSTNGGESGNRKEREREREKAVDERLSQ